MRTVPHPMVRFPRGWRTNLFSKGSGIDSSVLVTKNQYFNKGRSLERADLVFGNGLVMSEGTFYRRQLCVDAKAKIVPHPLFTLALKHGAAGDAGPAVTAS
ncbi:MAG: hypothetical protein DME45_12125 [Verrucomicrobia bacterium]|nr:MAG: hypothetical protein DME45_12125 [Verrucomicrobiota bacterium]